MNALEQLFCSRTRAGILSCLFGVTPQRLHLRACVRETGFSLGTLQQDLRKLVTCLIPAGEKLGRESTRM